MKRFSLFLWGWFCLSATLAESNSDANALIN